MNKKEKYLPIGTVVLLKNGKKRVMITGFCVKPEEDKNRIFDYSACLYPEGIVTSDKTILFDHNQIDKIYYIGYIDDEEKEFKENLNILISKYDNGEINFNVEE